MKIRNDLSLAVAILLISGCLSGQVQLSDTPAAHQLSNWLTAFNSGDRATFLAFLQKNYPARAGDIEGEMGFREATGGFDLKQAGDCAYTRCSAILKERDSDQFARIVVDIDPSEPHAIKGIELHAIPRPTEFSIPRMTEEEALKAFHVYLDRAAAAGRFSGAALVAKNGKPVFTAVYGMADREKKIPNILDTKFRIGSMNKMFTATAVLQLEMCIRDRRSVHRHGVSGRADPETSHRWASDGNRVDSVAGHRDCGRARRSPRRRLSLIHI